MNSSVLLSLLLVLLVQICISQATLTEGSAENDNLKQDLSKRLTGSWGKRLTGSWGKRLTGTWGKRLQSLWGKRSASDHDELYHRILREIYENARLNQLAHPQYSADDDVNPLTFDQLMAQRTTWNDDNENTAENMS